jgi:hypothetical protein
MTSIWYRCSECGHETISADYGDETLGNCPCNPGDLSPFVRWTNVRRVAYDYARRLMTGEADLGFLNRAEAEAEVLARPDYWKLPRESWRSADIHEATGFVERWENLVELRAERWAARRSPNPLFEERKPR